MKEFLKDVLIDPFIDGDWIDYIMGGLMWILMTAIVGGLLWLGLLLTDSSSLPLKKKEGVIIEHYYVPSHTTVTYVSSGKTMIPITNYISDSYRVVVEIDGLTDTVYLSYDNWTAIKVGDKFCFTYTNGRIWKTLYIQSFCEEEYS